MGFQCPGCVSAGRASVRSPRTAFGAPLSSGGGSATKALMGILALVYVLNFVSRGALLNLLALDNAAVYDGQFWRLLTYGLTSFGLFGVLMNLLVVWLAGRALESALGGWRFIALYLAAGLGGASLFFLFAPFGSAAVGASSAVVGLLSANAIIKVKGKEDIRPDIGLLVLLVLYSVLIGFNSFGWIGL
ncbi:MAG: rhomboid family intramembrane serine protease, partial [Propionibacteriaceae bacterium]|nr:rhomboid family intramembrane serine protease [Propionibacteriaceae bacterium]